MTHQVIVEAQAVHITASPLWGFTAGVDRNVRLKGKKC